MKSFRIFPTVALLGCLVFSSNTFAIIDNNAPIVQLRTSCTTGGVTLDNCFVSTASLVNWITTVRTPKPSVTAPLTVQVAPGTFDPLNLTCNAASGFTGYINFAGAGRDQSRFLGTGALVTHPAVIRNCTGLSFSNVKFQSANYGYIDWGGGGTSVWENVDIVGQSRGWLETCGSSPGLHYWFNSRITSSGFGINTPYSAACDKSWFYGSEISTNAMGPAVWATGTAELHIYGSNLRADDSIGGLTGDVIVARAGTNGANGSGGAIHLHGTGLDAVGGTGRNVHALEAYSGGTIHANGVGYSLSTGTGGTVSRIVQDTNPATHVHAPYLWESHPTPTLPKIVNVNADGADMVVQSLCASTGCQNAGTETHLLISNSSCTGSGGPWFDVVTRSCR